MTSAKAIQIAKEIDTARCKGNWSALPELARRYKKHNPDGTVLEQTILAEHALTQVLEKIKEPFDLYSNDSPEHLAFPPTVDRSSVNYAREQLVRASQSKNESESSQSNFAAVILARTLHDIGDYSKALNTLKQVAFRPEDVESGYALVLLVQARTIKGLCLERSDDIEGALQAYESILPIIQQHPAERGNELAHWVETSLYRGSLLKLGHHKDDVAGTLGLFREYYRQSASWSPMWRIRKRIVILRYFTKYLSSVYVQGKYIPSSVVTVEINSVSHISNYQTPSLFFIEIAQLHKSYEDKLYAVTAFPKAGQSNGQVIEFVNQLVHDLNLMGDAVSSVELRGLVETLYRAIQKTFNSPVIVRHLFIALVRLGEYDEAKHALQSYLRLIGLSTQAQDESRRNGEALVTYADGRAMPVPIIADTHVGEVLDEIMGTSGVENEALQFNSDRAKDEKTIASKHKGEQEHDLDILLCLMEAVRMFCKELDQGVEAVEVAELLHKVLKRSTTVTVASHPAICAQVSRMVGASYSLLASQTHDPEVRPKYHDTALFHLNHSIQIDPTAWETHYQLALQQAEVRDISHAIASVSQALRTNSSHTPSWHLLTLLSSCPSAGNLQQAIQSFELGLRETDLEREQNGNGDAANSISPRNYYTHEEGEQMLAFQTTGAVLQAQAGNSEAALESHESLFALYGKVSTIDPAVAAYNDYSDYSSRRTNGMTGSISAMSDFPRTRRRSASSGALGVPRAASSINVSRSQDDVNVRGGLSLSSSSISTNPSGSDVRRNGTSSTLNVPATLSEGENEKHLTDGEVQRSKSSHRRHLHVFGSRGKKSKKPENTYLTNTKEGTLTTIVLLGINGKSSEHLTADYRSIHSPTPSIGNKTSIRSIFQPTEPVSMLLPELKLRYQRSTHALTNLWLFSALAFIRLDKLEEARKAIEEAEGNDPSNNPLVWVVLGRLRMAQNRPEDAIAAFQKALGVNPYDADGRLWLARIYFESGEFEAAEGLLDRLTKGNGWDSAEALVLSG